MHDGGEAADARVVAEEVGEELSHRLFAERHEREPHERRRLHRRRPILGAEVDQCEAARGLRRLDDLSQIAVAGCVEPVQILEEQDRRFLALPVGMHDGADGGVGAALQRLRVHRRQRAVGVRYAEQVEEDRQIVPQALVEQQ